MTTPTIEEFARKIAQAHSLGREALLKAWVAATGVGPEDAILFVQTDWPSVTKFWVERKPRAASSSESILHARLEAETARARQLQGEVHKAEQLLAAVTKDRDDWMKSAGRAAEQGEAKADQLKAELDAAGKLVQQLQGELDAAKESEVSQLRARITDLKKSYFNATNLLDDALREKEIITAERNSLRDDDYTVHLKAERERLMKEIESWKEHARAAADNRDMWQARCADALAGRDKRLLELEILRADRDCHRTEVDRLKAILATVADTIKEA